MISLLSFSADEQEQMADTCQRIRERMAKQAVTYSEIENAQFGQPLGFKRDGYAFVMLRESDMEFRHNLMHNAALEVFEHTSASHCVVVAQDVKDKFYPYKAFALMSRGE